MVQENKHTEQQTPDADTTDPNASHPTRISPEERAAKIRSLKEQVQSGSYRPDTLEVAQILTRFLDPNY